MLTAAAIEASARDSFEMHRTRTRYRPLDAGVRAAPLEDAYRIQDAMHRLLAEAGRGVFSDHVGRMTESILLSVLAE